MQCINSGPESTRNKECSLKTAVSMVAKQGTKHTAQLVLLSYNYWHLQIST